jgi:hypothetical protein
MWLGTPVADGPPRADAQSTDRGHYDRVNSLVRRLRVARGVDARHPTVDGTRASPADRSDHGHDALAEDGGIVRIREVTAADRPDLADLHGRTSDENLYRRFLGSGEVHVPTDEADSPALEARNRMAERHSLTPLLAPVRSR